ncbi:phage Gp37/Gp68 family protein [Marivivens aquimaris]|uniref:phage Gp37/Gp68 family protein n=1 Tax=Marivivens aquimaris TaxID=2774876 RepID=UPI00187EF01E|nr:phage Gp37/Gp68 family protein [Marivivens aquimaris]
MAENSNIEWTDHTFNPWIGCQKVGPGCDNCYAETWDARGLQQSESRWGPHAIRTRTSAANWRKPLAWDRAAAAEGIRKRVFCASLADVFDNHPSIQQEWRDDLWALIEATPHLDWMLLTKRPSNIANMLPVPFDFDKQYPNVWLGCTVVNQAEADRDIPKLLAVDAAVRFLSMEPLQGPVDLTQSVRGILRYPEYVNIKLQLVIVGGESGPKARPMHPDWVRGLRDQCSKYHVAFHFKQWGEWGPCDHMGDEIDGAPFGCFNDAGEWCGKVSEDFANAGRQIMFRVGKKAAGRTLDGRTWDETPTHLSTSEAELLGDEK